MLKFYGAFLNHLIHGGKSAVRFVINREGHLSAKNLTLCQIYGIITSLKFYIEIDIFKLQWVSYRLWR